MPFKYAAFTAMTPEYTPDEALKSLSGLGYDGVEWRVMSMPKNGGSGELFSKNKATIDLDTIGEESAAIKEKCDESGLEIVGLGTYLSYKLLDDVDACMKAARNMDAGEVRVVAPKYDGSQNYHDIFSHAVDGFRKIEQLAQDHGVRANIEIRPGTICSSPSLAFKLVKRFDPSLIGVILDPANMIIEGYEQWQLALELLGPYLSYLHIKNITWAQNGDGKWKSQVVPMQEGFIDWKQFLAALDAVGYSGWISFEDFAPGDTMEKLKNNITYFKSLEKELGI